MIVHTLYSSNKVPNKLTHCLYSFIKGAYGDYIVVTPNLGLLYPAVTYLETQMHRKLNKEPFVNFPVAVNCIFLQNFDYTAAKVIFLIYAYTYTYICINTRV